LFFAFFSILIFFVVIILALIPQLVDSVSTFVSNISGYVTNFDQYLDSISGFATSYNININNYLDDISKFLQQFAATLPEKAVALGSQSVSAGRSLFNLFIAIILSVYFLADSEKLLRGFKRFMHGLLSEDVYERAGIFLHRCDKIMVNYIVCDLLDGLIVGVVTWIFMILLRMPYSVIIAVVVGITNLAPTFGPIVGGAIGCFILVLVNPISALIFLIYVLVIQTLDGYVIKPKLFGDSLGVSGLWILVGIIIGGRMMGVVGILLAIPVVAIIDFVYHDYLIVWLEERKKVAKESVEEKTKNE
jgi:predicted PurR-regulated permease PerM